MNQIGIYIITNTINKKFYIGSTGINFNSRFKQHQNNLKRGKHINRHLQRSFNKHGLEAFTFQILEVCEKSMLIEREQFFINTLKPHYNIAKNVGKTTLGIKFTKESRERLSKAKKGLKPKRTSPRRLSNKKVIRDDGIEYKNTYTAAQELGVKVNTLVKALTDKKISRKVKGYFFRYEDAEFPISRKINGKYIHKNGNYFIIRIGTERKYYGSFKTYEEAQKKLQEIIETQRKA